jgi:hypothetical protein
VAYAFTTYALAKAAKAALDAEHARAAIALRSIPGCGSGAMGLTPDDVKFSPEYRAAKRNLDLAFEQLRNFNIAFHKHFKKEIQADARRIAGARRFPAAAPAVAGEAP